MNPKLKEILDEGKETLNETRVSVDGMEKHEKKAMWVVAGLLVAAAAVVYGLVRLLT